MSHRRPILMFSMDDGSHSLSQLHMHVIGTNATSLLRHPVLWRDPLKGLLTFFFFYFFFPFFPPHSWSFSGPYTGKETLNVGGILQKHAYWHFLAAVIKYFISSHISPSCGHFLSKKYSKNHSVSPNVVKKSPIGPIFCRNMLMDSLQGQLKMVWLRSFFIELFE